MKKISKVISISVYLFSYLFMTNVALGETSLTDQQKDTQTMPVLNTSGESQNISVVDQKNVVQGLVGSIDSTSDTTITNSGSDITITSGGPIQVTKPISIDGTLTIIAGSDVPTNIFTITNQSGTTAGSVASPNLGVPPGGEIGVVASPNLGVPPGGEIGIVASENPGVPPGGEIGVVASPNMGVPPGGEVTVNSGSTLTIEITEEPSIPIDEGEQLYPDSAGVEGEKVVIQREHFRYELDIKRPKTLLVSEVHGDVVMSILWEDRKSADYKRELEAMEKLLKTMIKEAKAASNKEEAKRLEKLMRYIH